MNDFSDPDLDPDKLHQVMPMVLLLALGKLSYATFSSSLTRVTASVGVFECLFLMSHASFLNQEITNHFQLKMFCQISRLVKMSSTTGDFMPKSGRSQGLFHNGGISLCIYRRTC